MFIFIFILFVTLRITKFVIMETLLSSVMFNKIMINVKEKVRTLAYMSQTRDQQRFTISEVAADWHEPMVPQRIMWPSIACANGQLDP